MGDFLQFLLSLYVLKTEAKMLTCSAEIPASGCNLGQQTHIFAAATMEKNKLQSSKDSLLGCKTNTFGARTRVIAGIQ